MLCGPHCSQLSTILNNIATPNSGSTILLTSVNNVGRTTLFNPVKQQAHNFYACRAVKRRGERLNKVIHYLAIEVITGNERSLHIYLKVGTISVAILSLLATSISQKPAASLNPAKFEKRMKRKNSCASHK